jgi:hypothetical protein
LKPAAPAGMSVRKKAKGGYHRRNTTPIQQNPQNIAIESTNRRAHDLGSVSSITLPCVKQQTAGDLPMSAPKPSSDLPEPADRTCKPISLAKVTFAPIAQGPALTFVQRTAPADILICRRQEERSGQPDLPLPARSVAPRNWLCAQRSARSPARGRGVREALRMAYDVELADRIRAVVRAGGGPVRAAHVRRARLPPSRATWPSVPAVRAGLLLRVDPAEAESLITVSRRCAASRCGAGRWTAGFGRRGGFSPPSIRGHTGRTKLGDATGNRKGQP